MEAIEAIDRSVLLSSHQGHAEGHLLKENNSHGL